MSCTGSCAPFLGVFGGAARGGEEDFDPVVVSIVEGGVGDGDTLKFWAGTSMTRVGDCDGEVLSSILT